MAEVGEYWDAQADTFLLLLDKVFLNKVSEWLHRVLPASSSQCPVEEVPTNHVF